MVRVVDIPVCTYCRDGRCMVAGSDSGRCPSDPCCPMFRPEGVREAAWADVRAKGEAIALSGGVEIHRDDADEVEGYVMSGQLVGQFPVSDGGPYDTILAKRSWDMRRNVGGWVQGYLCDCSWGLYNSGSDRDGTGRFAGRFCSHAYALLLVSGLRARRDFMNDRLGAVGGKMICAHCGMEAEVSDNGLCRDCEERATFNQLMAYVVQGDPFGLRWLEANAHDDVMDAVIAETELTRLGDGVVLASWRGRKAVLSDGGN